MNAQWIFFESIKSSYTRYFESMLISTAQDCWMKEMSEKSEKWFLSTWHSWHLVRLIFYKKSKRRRMQMLILSNLDQDISQNQTLPFILSQNAC